MTTTTPIIKDPDARLDYTWDWTAWLAAGETITSHTVTVTTGDVVLDGHSVTGGVVLAWVKGGTLGTRAAVTCHIVTSAGREDDRTHQLYIDQR